MYNISAFFLFSRFFFYCVHVLIFPLRTDLPWFLSETPDHLYRVLSISRVPPSPCEVCSLQGEFFAWALFPGFPLQPGSRAPGDPDCYRKALACWLQLLMWLTISGFSPLLMIKPGSSALSLPEGHRTETPFLGHSRDVPIMLRGCRNLSLVGKNHSLVTKVLVGHAWRVFSQIDSWGHFTSQSLPAMSDLTPHLQVSPVWTCKRQKVEALMVLPPLNKPRFLQSRKFVARKKSSNL